MELSQIYLEFSPQINFEYSHPLMMNKQLYINIFLSCMLFLNQKKQRIQKIHHLKEQRSNIACSIRGSKSISPLHQDIYTSKNIHKRKTKDQLLTKPHKYKNQNRIAATDESSNNQQSNFQESIELFCNKPINQEYFQPLSFKQKKLKITVKVHQPCEKKLEDLSIKLSQMGRMVHNQDKQIHKMKSSMSEKELHRLLKMHSAQKLKLLTEIVKVSKSKDKKKA